MTQAEACRRVTERNSLLSPELPREMSRRQRFLRACYCRPVDYPPLWLMRQAGRALPEYRALKERYSFLQLVQTPELAAEVTLQPVRRFDFDAAILFSDILVVPEALGQGYSFRDAGGVQMDFTLRSAKEIALLNGQDLTARLQYVADAIRLIKAGLGERHALLGFAGSPWTLANFMLEGGSARQPTRATALFREERALFEMLLEKLTRAVIEFLRMQISAGVDGIQIFDSHGGLLPADDFEAASGRWIKQIVAALGGVAPTIVFSKGTHGNWDTLAGTGAQVISVDWAVRLAEVRQRLPDTIGIQGNLDPALLVEATPDEIAAQAAALIEEMRGRHGYVFNLGHGLPPDAKLENVERLVATVRTPL